MQRDDAGRVQRVCTCLVEPELSREGRGFVTRPRALLEVTGEDGEPCGLGHDLGERP